MDQRNEFQTNFKRKLSNPYNDGLGRYISGKLSVQYVKIDLWIHDFNINTYSV